MYIHIIFKCNRLYIIAVHYCKLCVCIEFVIGECMYRVRDWRLGPNDATNAIDYTSLLYIIANFVWYMCMHIYLNYYTNICIYIYSSRNHELCVVLSLLFDMARINWFLLRCHNMYRLCSYHQMIYIYTYTHTYILIYAHIHIQAYIRIFAYMYKHTRTHINIFNL